MKHLLLFTLAVLPAFAAPELPPGDRKLQGFRDPAPRIIPLWPGDGTRPDDPGHELSETLQEKGDDKVRITGVTRPTLHVWTPPNSDGRAVIIFPGGGYNILAAQHEGTEVAEWLNTQGITAFVAKYRVPRRQGLDPHGVALQDAQRAIRLVRSGAAEFGIDPDQIGVLGFSAGGNLAALTIHQAAKRSYEALDAVDQASARPDFAILVYPAYLAANRGEAGLNPALAPLAARGDYPPTFMTIAADDRFATGAIRYCLQLHEQQAPAEFHIYHKGGHGKGLRKDGYPFSTWIQPCERWLSDLKNGTTSVTLAGASPFEGSWAFALPDGNPAWLKIERGNAGYEGELLWSVGSARPVANLKVDGARLSFTRKIKWKPFGEEPVKMITRPITGTIADGRLVLSIRQSTDGAEAGTAEAVHLTGRKMPPIPPRPDLSAVTFDPPIDLLAGGLTCWRLTNPKKKSGWRVEKGILINETPKTDFGAYGSYGNLRTNREFEDFELTIDYKVAAGGNSGIYLRGMYEAQVVDRDSRMQGIQGPGAIFGRIAPSENAGNPGGEWNRYRLTLVDRHITVELNGKVVIDNQPLEGCTGGGISADDTAPGPIFLQGDHTSVQYRNISLRPVRPGAAK